jgi:hypothetical protein
MKSDITALITTILALTVLCAFIGSADEDLRPATAGPAFLGEESLKSIKHAMTETKRLGLELNMIAASSWNAGAYLKRQAGILLNLQFLTRLTMT